MAGGLLVGVGSSVITPPLGLPMAGFAARQGGSTGIHDDIMAKALVLDNGYHRVAIITLDIIGIERSMTESIRHAIARQTGLEADAIMVATSHNHSGPELMEPFGQDRRCSPYEEWIPVFQALVVSAVRQAWDTRGEAQYGVGVSEVQGIGVNRRGKNVVDNNVGILRVDRDGRTIAVVVNYTCHAVVLGPDNRLISADYPGYTQRYLEDYLGENVVALFTNGAAGDINTGHSADTSAIGGAIPGRTFERAEELGKRLALSVIDTLPQIEMREYVSLGSVICPWKPRYREDLPSEVEIARRINELSEKVLSFEEIDEKEAASSKLEFVYTQIMLKNALERSAATDGTKPTEVQAIRVGETALVSLPGEVFAELGLAIKARSPFPVTFVVGYANDSIGYIPTRQALSEGGYESISCKFVPGTGEDLVEAAVTCLNELYIRGTN
jgi:neutral ceramidase